MQTPNVLVATVATGNSAGKGMTATANGTTDAGFGKMLVQVMAGTATEGQTTALPDLGQLMAALFGGAAAADSNEGQASGIDPEVLALMLQKLSEQPESLDKLLGDDDMQSWLMQAAMLLQGMGMPVAAVEDQVAVMNGGQETETVQPAALNAGQAQAVMQAFAKLLQQQPDNVFVAQLQEKFEGLLAAQAQGKETVTSTKETGKKQKEEDGSPNGTVQVSTASTSATRLEILAAKSRPVQHAELISGQTEKESGTNAQSDDNNLTAVPAQDTASRFTLVKEAAPLEATVRSHALAEDISKLMMGKMRIQSGNGLTEARLTLTPEALGKVDVTLSMQNGQLVAHFAAQTSMGKDALEAQLAQLRATLQSQGIQVERMEVTQSPTLQSSMFHDQRGQQQSQQFNRQSEGKSNDGGEEYAAEATAILNDRGQSAPSGFDVTA